MSSTTVSDEGYDDLEDEEGLSGFWVLTIFLIVLCVFSAIVWFAYQKGRAEGELPTIVATPEITREEIPLDTSGNATRQAALEELNEEPTRVVAEIDEVADPLDGYEETTPPVTDDLVAAAIDDASEEEASVWDTQLPPVPSPAPNRTERREEQTPAATTPAPATNPVATTPVQGRAGSWAVQVGAFGSENEAMTNYRRMSDRIGALVSGQSPEVNVAVVNGVTYHRLWLGEFTSRDAAQTHCNSLKAAGQDCLARRR